MDNSEHYVKAYAIRLVKDGLTPAEAVKKAREAWAARQEAEQAVEREMSK